MITGIPKWFHLEIIDFCIWHTSIKLDYKLSSPRDRRIPSQFARIRAIC
jgi:hypothetical protein